MQLLLAKNATWNSRACGKMTMDVTGQESNRHAALKLLLTVRTEGTLL